MKIEHKIGIGVIVMLGILAIIIFTGFITMGWFIGNYNKLSTGRVDIATQWSNVKTEYQRRADLLYNMAEVVKSYAKFEEKTLISIAAARSGNFGTTKTQEISTMKQQDAVSTTLMGNFVKLQEMYPELKTSEQYMTLLNTLQDTENRINIARTDYNNIVRSYNLMIVKFPSNFIASSFNFQQEQFYINEETTNTAPKLDMNLT